MHLRGLCVEALRARARAVASSSRKPERTARSSREVPPKPREIAGLLSYCIKIKQCAVRTTAIALYFLLLLLLLLLLLDRFDLGGGFPPTILSTW